MFTKAHHLSLFSAKINPAHTLTFYSLSSISLLYPTLCRLSFLQVPHQNVGCISLSAPFVPHAPPTPLLLDFTSITNIRLEEQTMILLIMPFSLFTYYFLTLRPKHLPQDLITNTFSLKSALSKIDPCFIHKTPD